MDGRAWLRRSIAAMGWHLPLRERLSPRSPVVLAYHGVPRNCGGLNASTFECQLRFLKQYCDFCSWRELNELRSPECKIRVLLTFDDGFRNNAEVVAPLLRKYEIPAIFFVTSRHLEPGRHLWFTYLQMLERHFRGAGFAFREEYFDMGPQARTNSVARLRATLLALNPHPAAMYDAIEKELPRVDDHVSRESMEDEFAGMSVKQLAELASDPLFRIGSHTLDHPFLPLCDKSEQLRQLAANKSLLESVTGMDCDALAYPGGDYNPEVIRTCRVAGFTRGFALHRKAGIDPLMEIRRVDIYSPSVTELGFKLRWGNLLMWAHARGFVSSA